MILYCVLGFREIPIFQSSDTLVFGTLLSITIQWPKPFRKLLHCERQQHTRIRISNDKNDKHKYEGVSAKRLDDRDDRRMSMTTYRNSTIFRAITQIQSTKCQHHQAQNNKR